MVTCFRYMDERSDCVGDRVTELVHGLIDPQGIANQRGVTLSVLFVMQAMVDSTAGRTGLTTEVNTRVSMPRPSAVASARDDRDDDLDDDALTAPGMARW
jgi:hypothetical protein